MNYRKLGKTNLEVSEIGFGAWAIGADWGDVSELDAQNALNTAIDNGVNFIDTADVYGMGRSEKIIGELSKTRKEKLIIATKAGRQLNPHTAEQYTYEAIEKFVDSSLKNLQVDSLDLLQLHCPPTDVYYKPELFSQLDELIKKGKIKNLGVSVEKIEEAIKAMEYENISTIQIVFNIFRQRPSELFFDLVKKNDIGILARVPLASGLLTGKYSIGSEFSKDDHRNYNRNGEAFDVGETFSGINYEKGLEAVEKIRAILPEDFTMAQFGLKWILDFPEVSTVIPGAKNEKQALDNALTSTLRELTNQEMSIIRSIYENNIKSSVHQKW